MKQGRRQTLKGIRTGRGSEKMARMRWMSMLAGVGIGAACAMTLAKRNGQGNQRSKEGSGSLQSLATDFLKEENETHAPRYY
jgi:hypothetical protein